MKRTSLKVIEARIEEIFRDTVRVAEENRVDQHGNIISSGAICKISCGNKHTWAIIRGIKTSNEREMSAVILIDGYLREKLGVCVGEERKFEFKTGYWQWLRFGWSATDPGYRISYMVAVFSMLLGLISIFLTIWQAIK